MKKVFTSVNYYIGVFFISLFYSLLWLFFGVWWIVGFTTGTIISGILQGYQFALQRKDNKQ